MRPVRLKEDATRRPAAAGVVILCCLLVAVLQAGGPLIVEQGQPGHWEQEVPFALDQGPLGTLENAQAADLIRLAAGRWEAVTTSTARFAERPPLSLDLTADNIIDFFGGEPRGGGDIRPENPIVFDHDGSIIDQLMGEGASASVLAFAGPRFINTNTRTFLSGFAVLNGRFADSQSFASTVVHEFGHLLGLDHTQANRQLADNGDTGDNEHIPLMYPFAIPNAVERPLHDDAAWISWLNPTQDFEAVTGAISGRVTRRDGSPLLGANVVAVRLNPDDSESLQAVSVVSGFLLGGDGSYLLPGLNPGRYVVFIEPLDGRFVGGSSVGPFDQRFDQFPKDYYNGINETGTNSDNPLAKSILSLEAGQEIVEIDLVANEGNLPPVVDAGEPRTVQSGQVVQLAGSAEDPDGDPLTLVWTQTQGPAVELSKADTLRPSFLAPGTPEAVALVFRLTVDDGLREVSDSVRITVIPVPGNRPPVVDAGPDQVASNGQMIVLQGQVSDPDGDALSLNWTQLTGPAVNLQNSTQAQAFFVAPGLEQSRELTFQLTASDGKGGVAQDRAVVTVVRNRPPVVEVTPFLAVMPGDEVILEAQAEDPEHDPLTFHWEQTSGPPLDLQETSSQTLVFQAPDQPSTAYYGFQVEVSDGGASVIAASVVLVGSSAPVIMPASLRIGDERLRNAFVAGAVLHDSAASVPVLLHVRDRQGRDILEPQADLQLGPGAQWAFLTDQLTRGHFPGTLSLQGLEAPLSGFFLMGDTPGQRLDGVGGLLEINSKLYLQAVGRDANLDTLVYLHNPDPTGECELTLRLYTSEGQLEDEAEAVLAPGGTLLEMLEAVFDLADGPGEPELVEGYVTVEGSRPLLGLQMLVDEEAFVALPASAPRETLRLRAPHFFTDGERDTTVLRLLNAGEKSMQVRVTAYDDQSNILGTVQRTVEPGAVLNQPVFDLLQSPSPGTITAGYLEVLANEGLSGPLLVPATVTGSVIFSTNNGKARSSLPLVEEPSERFRFLHVAQSRQLHFFQGLALLNTSASPAQITLRAFDVEGALTAEVQLRVESGQRIVDLLSGETFFGESFDQTGGHLRLESSVPIYSFSLFTNSSQSFLSAVEGQPVR
ncbi:MAG TPA: Ig-like domain-containing protein [Acidobacteriota bacterium]|nr:Ig-like domain-containing protein [Acidobacteriota bacterium]